jgi:ubiquinol-cytochrome c reductase cytochrome b subunit
VLKDAVACLAVLATVLFLIWLPRLKNPAAPLGVELGAPANPSEAFSAARPEWYFLFLFQFLKYFPGETEIIGAMIIPSLLMFVLFLMPILGRWKLGHTFNLGFCVIMLFGAGLLTWLAKRQDGNDPTYLAAVREAESNAERVRFLAQRGIPREGALALLQDDPLTQGPRLFARRCASCHRYGGHNGTGLKVAEAQTAPDLKGFGSAEWLAQFLNPQYISSSNCFGGTKFKDGKMVRFVNRTIANLPADQKPGLDKIIAALSAEAQLPHRLDADRKNASVIEEGRALFDSDTFRCSECHQFRKKNEDANAPDLTGWGSHEWLHAFIENPAHERFYGKRNDRMPVFGESSRLDPKSIDLLVRWLREE